MRLSNKNLIKLSIQRRKRFKERKRFQEYQKRKRKKRIGYSEKEKKKREALAKKFKHYTKVRAPYVFSLIKNPDEMLDFILSIQNCIKERKAVFVAMRDIREATTDAIAVLLSIMIEVKAKGLSFNGDFPKDKTVNRLLKQSQFFRYLYSPPENYEEDHEISQGYSIHTHAQKKVDSVLGGRLIKLATKSIWGEAGRCPGVQRTLLELMVNTNNHASRKGQGRKNWWVSIHENKKEKKVAFSFIDYGMGIFTSLNGKPQDSWMYGRLNKIRSELNLNSNAHILRKILEGYLHKTETGKPNRGKGLPAIAGALERNQISNLRIITNNVFANVKEDEYRDLPESFHGTFVYWELTNECEVINAA